MKRGRPVRISDDDIRELHADGCTNIEMAEILDTKPTTITHRLRKMGLTRNPTRRRFCKQYAAYDRDTEQLLAIGTVDELERALGIRAGTIRSYASAVRNNHWPLPAILIREVKNVD